MSLVVIALEVYRLYTMSKKCPLICCLTVSELKVVSQQKEAEVSELKVKIDELQVTAGRETKSREELQLHYQQRLREKQAELYNFRRLDTRSVCFR